MDTSHMLALADGLTANEETILGPTDSYLVAAALRVVAGLVGNDALLRLIVANDNADLRPALAVCVGVSAAGNA